MSDNTGKVPFDQDLFDLLICPEAGVPLKLCAGRLVSTDAATRRSYSISGDIPVMLVEESQVVPEDEWRRLMAGDGPVGGGVAAVRARTAG